MTVEEALRKAQEAAAEWHADNKVRVEIHDEVRTMESAPNRVHTMEARLMQERASSLGDSRQLTTNLNASFADLSSAILAEAAAYSAYTKGRKSK